MGASQSIILNEAQSVLQNEAVKNVTAFAAASEVIIEEMNVNKTMTYGQALQVLTRYDNAFTKVKEIFPGAEIGTEILRQADQVLIARGCTAANTLFAQSICPDEINHESGDITELFTKRMGEVFHMGGLAGIPFTGRTGFAAFSHHIPDDGNLFVLFAPHVGLSETGVLGKYTRAGQHKDGTACGAACGALKYCMDCRDHAAACALDGSEVTMKIPIPGQNFGDYQMEFIISEVNKLLEGLLEIPTEDGRQAALAMEMYNIAQKFINKAINFDETFASPNRKPTLYLLGGIQINMPKPMPDFFMPLMFEARLPDGDTLDLMKSAFGNTPGSDSNKSSKDKNTDVEDRDYQEKNSKK